ncbi:hypothetical protein KGA68_07330 [Halomonas boliviensis]|nr:hypothetical protein [Halomonas boliviensis]
MPVIIDNPCQKSWGYRSRDTLITLATLALWVLVMARLYMFFIVEEAILEQLYASIMIKIVLMGFLVTFLTFHCWSVYNKHLYTNYLKRQLSQLKQPTIERDNDTESQIDTEQSIQEQEIVLITNQTNN